MYYISERTKAEIELAEGSTDAGKSQSFTFSVTSSLLKHGTG
jgi:hypothetical protein